MCARRRRLPDQAGERHGPKDSDNLEPFFSTILSHVPAPEYDEEAPLQAHVTNLDADNFLGRIALLRVEQGELRKGQSVTWIKRDGTMSNVRITELLMTEALTRKPAEKAGPGDICAVAGIADIMIARPSPTREPDRAAAHHGRRAGDLHDHRHQHLAAGRPWRHR